MHDRDREVLRRRLLQEGVKPPCVRRTLQELDDHYQDLYSQAVADGMSVEQAAEFATVQVGDPWVIAEEILSRPELKSWDRRFPKAFFVAGPVLVYVSVITLLTLLIVGLLVLTKSHFSAAGAAIPVWFQTLVDATMFFMKYIFGQVLSIILFLYAYHRRASFLWPCMGIIVLAMVSSGFTGNFVWPLHAGDKGVFTLGMGVDTTRLIITLCLTSLFAVLYRSLRYRNEAKSGTL